MLHRLQGKTSSACLQDLNEVWMDLACAGGPCSWVWLKSSLPTVCVLLACLDIFFSSSAAVPFPCTSGTLMSKAQGVANRTQRMNGLEKQGCQPHLSLVRSEYFSLDFYLWPIFCSVSVLPAQSLVGKVQSTWRASEVQTTGRPSSDVSFPPSQRQ